MIEFYGSPMSSAGRTHWLLEEIGVPYVYKRVDIRKGETRTPEFLALYPTGKIPVLKDGDFVLGESMAINFYLAEKYQPALLPSDYRQRAELYQWSFWALTNLQPPVLTCMFAAMSKPESGEPAPTVQAAKHAAEQLLAALEHKLTGRSALVGTGFTLADLHVGSVANIALGARLLSEQRFPSTWAWLESLRARPAFQRVAQAT